MEMRAGIEWFMRRFIPLESQQDFVRKMNGLTPIGRAIDQRTIKGNARYNIRFTVEGDEIHVAANSEAAHWLTGWIQREGDFWKFTTYKQLADG